MAEFQKIEYLQNRLTVSCDFLYDWDQICVKVGQSGPQTGSGVPKIYNFFLIFSVKVKG